MSFSQMETLKLILVMLRFFASLVLFLVTSYSVSAQDLLFNAPCWSNRAYFNPSATANTSFSRNSELQFSGKRQWAGIASSPQLIGLALDYSMNDKNGLGLQIWKQDLGTFSFSTVQIPYSFEAKFNENISLLLGVSSKIYSINADFTKLQGQQSIDVTPDSYNLNQFDASFGASIMYRDKLRVGFFSNNFLVGLDKEDLSFGKNVGSNFGLDLSYKLNKSDNIQYIFDSFLRSQSAGNEFIGEFWLRMLAQKYAGGIGYSSNDEIDSFIGLNIGPKVSLRYFYTYNLSPIQQFSTGSHQVGVAYSL
jgi:type IX secretion system PorP/SprF family membrane protein